VAVGKYNYCFKLTGIEHIIFENIQFRYYGSGKQAAVVLKDASDIRFQTCTFDFNDVGILLSGETNNTIIHHCFFSDGNGDWKFWRMKATYEGVYLPGCSGNNIITDNLPGSTLVNNENNRGLESGGVFISGDFSGKGMIIKSSTFHDIVQGLTMTPQSWWVDSGKSFEFDFYANEVYNCSEDAIEADVFPRNVRIWQNDIHHTNSAISAAPAANGPLLIYNNIIHDLTTDTTLVAAWGETVAGRSLKVQSGSSDTSSSIYFMHNTVDAPWDQYAMDLLKGVGESWHTFRFLNNIWRTNNLPSFRLRANTPGPLTSDFNSLHAYNTSASIIQYLGKDYFDFAMYQDETGLEEHSFYGDPLFSDVSNGDYSLKEVSPLIDQAVIIPGLNDNGLYCPDIGAIESFDECSVSVHEEDKDVFNLSLFPNPFSSGTLTLKFASPLPKASQLVIRDMMGRRITSCDLAASMLRMDLELDLPPGIYVCFLQTKASAFLSSRLLCVQ
jgi:hypothetical protein